MRARIGSMPQCINDPKTRYTGKEPSPKGRGYCAHATPISARKKGTDGQMYTVASRSNGTKFWKKVPTVKAPAARKIVRPPKQPKKIGLLDLSKLPKKIGLFDLYTVRIPSPRWARWGSQLSAAGRARLTKLRQQVIPALCAAGIPTVIVPLPKDPQNGGYWMDLAWDWATEKLGYPPGDNGPVMICVLWLGVDPSEVSKTKTNITIQHMFLKQRHRVLINEIMHAAFGKAFTWNVPQHEMQLSLI